ncbi:pre-rRNA-processing protein TSR1 homolog [Microcaecilia unicolor]|uniref:Pre-rRNA-processing protein TSR1 homolog n=1 Tax=Microcaecilia unicolor TaxID=1415580 RepID=A0A6P7ZFC3_9AMPH|nr:pre-rRNA-processing protein TSR1 homolog [Microcaecilia unicolor]
MMAADKKQVVHRAGALKQQNKQHKQGKHRSKGELERESRGRVSAKILSKRIRKDLSKLDRKHKLNQIRRQRKDAVLSEKRNLGSKDGPPHLVVLVPLHTGIDIQSALKLIKSDAAAIVHQSEQHNDVFALICPRFKQRWIFISAIVGDFHALLDLAKVADTLLFLVDAQEGWDSYGDYCLSCLFAQGLPTYALAVQGVHTLSLKKQNDAKKNLSKTIKKRFPDAKVFSLDTEQEAAVLLRQMATQKQHHLAFRDQRTYLLAQKADFLPSDETALVGNLKVSGYIRGQTLNVNSLVHIVGHGDFQMSQIDAPADPFPLNPRIIKIQVKKGEHMQTQDGLEDGGVEMEQDLKVLMKADPRVQESLQSEVVPDPMEGEQTWPSEEELKEAEESLTNKGTVVKKVPKGTSSYQAAWIVDDESGEEEDSEDGMEKKDMMDESVSGDENEEDDEEQEEEDLEAMSIVESACDERYDENIDEREDQQMLEKYRQQRQDEMFPDEVDTPQDGLCRVRFQKYRGLQSFRTSPWDAKENLPTDYARIFQFHNFSRTRKRILREREVEEMEGAMVGWYVTVHVCAVPISVLESFQRGAPLVLFSLLPYEQKMSVLNLLVRRHLGNSTPVKAKEEMIVHCGFRRFQAKPLYSQHTSADKHKAECFLRPDTAVVATVYSPIMFPPASVLMFRQRSNGMHDLVATGSLLTVDPDRIIIKRIILSGHPFKILKKTAVVRYMFFNREDILWFKLVELRTKWGCRGHIKEPLGTHGHMKCFFNRQLKSQDTVLMNLYKRVFPKWTYEPYVPEPVPWLRSESLKDVQEVEME